MTFCGAIILCMIISYNGKFDEANGGEDAGRSGILYLKT